MKYVILFLSAAVAGMALGKFEMVAPRAADILSGAVCVIYLYIILKYCPGPRRPN